MKGGEKGMIEEGGWKGEGSEWEERISEREGGSERKEGMKGGAGWGIGRD